MKNGKFLAGVIFGLGAGAVLGVLFAPARGSETRKRFLKGNCATDQPKITIHDIVRKNKEKLQQQAEENDRIPGLERDLT